MTRLAKNQSKLTDERATAGETPEAAAFDTAKKNTPARAVRPKGKLDTVLKAIERKRGATLAELTEATGWLPHTTRAALTRLRQRGFAATLVEESGRKAYRLQE